MFEGPRPSRDDTLMEVAGIFARRSTCSRLHVGAVFSRDGRILVTGYNGAPKGLPHCNHECTCADAPVKYSNVGKTEWGAQQVKLEAIQGPDQQWHNEDCRLVFPCTTAEHAERNAIAWAARNGVKLEGSELHVTHMPCLPCAMSLVNAGVERVMYHTPYRILDGVELLDQAGISVIQWMPQF